MSGRGVAQRKRGTRVTGVKLHWRNPAEEASVDALSATLVVDASGRNSDFPD